mmetsp:Transcript_10368/g.21595  ORF Transcript_10368/g.21595 Transcript_10368/m.21595 type:complete len:243 (+) Transcript_10368:1940-2668(+)
MGLRGRKPSGACASNSEEIRQKSASLFSYFFTWAARWEATKTMRNVLDRFWSSWFRALIFKKAAMAPLLCKTFPIPQVTSAMEHSSISFKKDRLAKRPNWIPPKRCRASGTYPLPSILIIRRRYSLDRLPSLLRGLMFSHSCPEMRTRSLPSSGNTPFFRKLRMNAASSSAGESSARFQVTTETTASESLSPTLSSDSRSRIFGFEAGSSLESSALTVSSSTTSDVSETAVVISDSGEIVSM